MRTIINAGGLVNRVLDVSIRKNDEDMRRRLYVELNKLYLRFCASHPFEMLRRSKVYEAGDSNIVPANAAGVRWVEDSDDGVYVPQDDGPSTEGKKYFVLKTITGTPNKNGLPFVSEDCSIDSGEDQFTSELLGEMIAKSKIPSDIVISGSEATAGTYGFVEIKNAKPRFSFVTGIYTYDIEHDGNGLWLYKRTSTEEVILAAIASDDIFPPLTDWVDYGDGSTFGIDLLYNEEDGVDPVGEFVKIGEDDELFEIIEYDGSTFTIDRTYRGESQVDAVLYVRLPITQEITLYDETGEEVDDTDYTVYYWIIPPAIRKASDLILLPSSESLELQLIRSAPEAKENRPVGAAEINSAMIAVKKMNPDNIPSKPRKRRVQSISSMDTSTIYSGTR